MSTQKFVGRVRELNHLQSAANKINSTLILLIFGNAAIGKTWLNLEFYRKVRNIGINHSKLIDLTNMSFRFIFVFLDRIINDFGYKSKMKNYDTKKLEYEGLVLKQAEEEVLQLKKLDVYEAFISDFNAINERKIILLDTFDEEAEIFDNFNIIDFVTIISHQLTNCLTVISGRDAKLEKLKISSDKFEEIELKEFSKEEVSDFVQINLNIIGEATKEKTKEIEEIKEKVYFLSQGRPLLMHMTNEYFKIPDLPYPKVLSKSLEELKSHTDLFSQNQEEFENDLFKIFGDSYNNIKPIWPNAKIILLMALFEKRVTIPFFSYIIGLSISEIEKIFDTFEEIFFFKKIPDEKQPKGYRFTLHDVFRDRLKLEWNRIDRMFLRRKEFILKGIEFYDTLIKNSSIEVSAITDKRKKDELNLEIDTLILEKYFYIIEYLFEEHSEYISNEILHAIKTDNKKIFNIVSKSLYSKLTDVTDNPKFKTLAYQLSRFLRITSKFSTAENILLDLINNEKEDNIFKLECYQTLTFVYRDQGELDKAKQALESSTSLLSSLSTKNIPDLHLYEIDNLNNQGQVLTSEGIYLVKNEQNEMIGGALYYFDLAFKLAKKYQSFEDLCSIQQNLSETYLLQGELTNSRRALNFAKNVIPKIENKLFREHLNLLNQARLETADGNYELAYTLFDLAENYFEKTDNHKWKAVVINHRSRTMLEHFSVQESGIIEITKTDDEIYQFLLNTYEVAKKSDIECKTYYSLYLAESLMNTADTEIQIAKFHKKKQNSTESNKYFDLAISKLESALELTKTYKNKRTICNILAVQAFYFFDRFAEKEPEKALMELKSILDIFDKQGVEGTAHHAFKGEILLLIGRLEYMLNNKEKAFESFKLCIPYLAEVGYYSMKLFPSIVNELCDLLQKEDNHIVSHWYKEYKEHWIDRPDNRIYQTEQNTIDDRLLLIEFQLI